MRESNSGFDIIEFRNVQYDWFMQWQADRVTKRAADEVRDCVVLVSFADPVYTAPQEHDSSVGLTISHRGGGDSWHGPGQLCIVPIVRLAEPVDIRAFTSLLERPVRDVCASHDVTCDPRDDLPGVAVDGKKIAQVGLCLTSRVTSFGIAFNIDCDPSVFSAIDLCGIPGCPVTNLSIESGSQATVEGIMPMIADRIRAVFP